MQIPCIVISRAVSGRVHASGEGGLTRAAGRRAARPTTREEEALYSAAGEKLGSDTLLPS